MQVSNTSVRRPTFQPLARDAFLAVDLEFPGAFPDVASRECLGQTEAEYNGEVAKIKAMVEAKAITWDVIDVDTAIRGLLARPLKSEV